MAWGNNRPGSHIPDRTKQHIRTRQHNRCNTYNPAVCTGSIDEFDHITNLATLRIPRHQANQPANIQGLCTPCHKAKTQDEAQQARRRHLRPKPQHPSD